MERTRPLQELRRGDVVVPGLLLLTLVPAAAGSLRLIELAGGPAIVPDGDRYGSMPLVLGAHIVAAILFGGLGALQFSPTALRRTPTWHRRIGWVSVVSGGTVALSGMLLPFLHPWASTESHVLVAARLVVGIAVLCGLLLGTLAARRRDLRTHRAWMIRTFALAMGAGTQVFTNTVGIWLESGAPTPSGRAVTMLFAWALNLAIAEALVRRRAGRLLAGGA